MSDSPHLVNALDAVERGGETVPELTARIILLYGRLVAIDAEAAADLVRDLPNGWHRLHIVH